MSLPQVILVAREPELADAWDRFCGDLSGVSVHRGSIFDVACDAVVSPANSFGFMDGGIDALYTQRFGRGVQERLQAAIRAAHDGELLVGRAEIVWTEDAAIPFVIAAPTMRVPMILRDTVNPYLAMRATLLLTRDGRFNEAGGPFAGTRVADAVRTIAVPGLGTGIGKVGPNICARQVRAAIESMTAAVDDFPQTWADAQSRHQLLYGDRFRDLQRE